MNDIGFLTKGALELLATDGVDMAAEGGLGGEALGELRRAAAGEVRAVGDEAFGYILRELAATYEAANVQRFRHRAQRGEGETAPSVSEVEAQYIAAGVVEVAGSGVHDAMIQLDGGRLFLCLDGFGVEDIKGGLVRAGKWLPVGRLDELARAVAAGARRFRVD